MKMFTAWVACLVVSLTAMAGEHVLEFKGKDGPGKGKTIVLISGDEEYRSEEAMPLLAKILSQHHGFDCKVLFAWDDDGAYIDPNNQAGIRGWEELKTADLVIIGTRFRRPTENDGQHLSDFMNAGKPIIGLRTATHGFIGGGWFGGKIPYRVWGKMVLGVGWDGHHGKHKVQGARGVIEDANKNHPILRGVTNQNVFAPSDVYRVRGLQEDDLILLRGAVTETLDPSSANLKGEKNDPLQPSSWLHPYVAPNGTKGMSFCTTMGASVDLVSEGLRRIIVNAAFYLNGLEVPPSANVAYVDPFYPTFYGFIKDTTFWPTQNKTAADFGLGKSSSFPDPEGTPKWDFRQRPSMPATAANPIAQESQQESQPQVAVSVHLDEEKPFRAADAGFEISGNDLLSGVTCKSNLKLGNGTDLGLTDGLGGEPTGGHRIFAAPNEQGDPWVVEYSDLRIQRLDEIRVFSWNRDTRAQQDYDVALSSDGGSTWQPVATGVTAKKNSALAVTRVVASFDAVTNLRFMFREVRKGIHSAILEIDALGEKIPPTAEELRRAAMPVELQQGDTICVIGNSLADRMQHDGWVEAVVQSETKGMELSWRDMGYSGDTLMKRSRSRGWWSAEQYLSHAKADVIFAFFGYNESFSNDTDQFEADLKEMVGKYKGQKFNGSSAPRIVLFSPIAFENHGVEYLPDGKEHNERLAKYTTSLEKIAKELDVGFVDLFNPSAKLYTSAKSPLTLNGVHLTAEGNRQLAEVIGSALFMKSVTADSSMEKLRQAILDKNWHWHNRYRATDGNDIWGSRSVLSFVDGQTNAVVLQHELTMLDVMTANRDKRVWAVANGGDLEVDDSNVPAAIPVKSNVGGLSESSNAEKEGSISYDEPADALKKLKPREGFTANLFADETRFPQLINPVQLGVDPKGRLWAAAWPTYPKWEPLKEMNDALLILPDDNGDGVADRVIEFAKVHNPTGFTFWNGGVIVVSQPDILFLKDTDGDDKADVRQIIMQGLDSADTHHAANSLIIGPDGGLFYMRGVYHNHSIEQPWRTTDIRSTYAVYRFNPRNYEFRFHASIRPNPHGMGFDYWGYHYATDGTSGHGFQVVPQETGFRMRNFFRRKVRPVAGGGVISSQHFPDEMQGDYLICNTIGFLGLKQYKPDFEIAKGEADGVLQPDLLVSSEKNFRPTDIEFGADGALYVSDWSNVTIGHMQHNIRDPKRDHSHGRIYRVTAIDRPLQKDVPVHGQSIEKLLDNLKHPVNGIRERSRAELSTHSDEKVLAATAKWLKQFDVTKKEDAHHLLEGLWIYQRLGVKNYELLNNLLVSPEPHAVNAAKLVDHYWSGKADLPAPDPKKEPEKWTRPEGLAKNISDEEFKLGHEVFNREAHCATCHQENGTGMPKMYPPLKGPWVTGSEERLIKLALHGLMGEMEVEGKKYGVPGMPPMTPFKDMLNDKELAAVLTYARNSFGNKASRIDPATVARIRASEKTRGMFWNPAELLKAHPIEKK